MKLLRTFLLGLAAGAVPLAAQPSGGQIAAGAGAITTTDLLTRVAQTSDRLVIDWNTFSIPAGATVEFAQPGALAAVLNRVTGAEMSTLLGTLRANGQVYLLNPNGVLVGATGRVETAGFIAATTRLANEDFLRGTQLNFTGGTDAAIVNRGTVLTKQGPIVFIARQVENAGSLQAPGGTVQLVGGTEVFLATPDSPAVIRAGSADGDVANGPAAAIEAAQVRLQAVGNNPAALAINQEGVIRATGVAERNGEVWLVGGGEAVVAQRGQITATNADGTGGAIRATGGRLLVAAGSITDASGAAGGGTVELGGAAHGATGVPGQANAGETVVEAGAQIAANATAAGNGGQVVLWGSRALGFYGSVAARGAAGGAGGFVETSGTWLDLFGRVDTGAGGTWLVDPFNIRIVDGPSSGITISGTNPAVAVPTSSESRLDVRAIEQAIATFGSVVLDTGGPGSDVGNIIIDAPLIYNGLGLGRLTLNAANDIFVNHDLVARNNELELNFNADANADGRGQIVLGANLKTLGGTVTFQENVVTTGTQGLSIQSGGGNIIFAGNLHLDNTDGLDLSSQGGDILMSTLSSSLQRNAILRLTDLGSRNLYSAISALLANPVPTPAATVGYESGRLVKRRTLRRVNNPPGFQTVLWMSSTEAYQAPTSGSLANFGPTQSGRPPFDDSYMDAPFAKPPGTTQNPPTTTAGTGTNRPPIDDSYMDAPFTRPTTNPPATTGTGGGTKPPFDDSYMDFPWKPQTGTNSPTNTAQTNPPTTTTRPPIDDSYMDAPFIKPPTNTGSNQGAVVTVVQGTSKPVEVTVTPPVTPQAANGPVLTITQGQPPPSRPGNGPNQPGNPQPIAVPSVPLVVNNPEIPQPPAQTPRPPVSNPPAVIVAPPLSVVVNNPDRPQPPVRPPVVNPPAVIVAPPLTVVVNNPEVIAPPAQQPGPVVMTPVPQVPVTSGPQNNPGALQGPNTPTVVATQPSVIVAPPLTVVVNNPEVIAPPAQPTKPVVLTPVPQLPLTSGPQNNVGALQAPDTPTVVATQPTVVAVPSLPVVVNNPPDVPQPPAQQPGPVVMTPVPQVPVNSGPQNNPGALQAPNTPTVVATQPTVMAVPSLPVVVNNPPNIPQPPAQPTKPVVLNPVPQLPVTSGPQNNPGALQAPDTPTVVATQPTVVAVPPLPVVVNNPPNIPQPPAQQPGPVVVQAVPQVPVNSGPQNNPGALQGPNTPTVVATNPTVMAVPSLPVVVNNPPDVPQPPAQPTKPVVMTPVPQVPVTNGPENNPGALQAPNTPTVVATNPTAMAVPSLPVVVNNPPDVPQPPAQPTKPVVMTPVPQVPVTNGPENNPGALQAPNTPTVVATNSTVMAVPSLPVVVNNPPDVPQPPAQPTKPVVMTPVPQVPVNSGPQNNPGALQAPNTPTVVATQPTAVAVPALPVVVNNPPNIPQPPAQPTKPVVMTPVPQVPVTNGPQNNPGALQAPNTPTVVATNPTVTAVPSLPVVVNNPPNIPQPPAQQPGPVVVQAVPQVPVNSGPQNNAGALQAPNTPTVVATNPTLVAVPSVPVVVNNPPNIPQPPAQPTKPVVLTPVPQVPPTSGPQNHPGALQAPNTPTVVATQPTAVAVPALPVVVNNPPNIPQPPAQQPGPVVMTPVPQVPVTSGPQNHPGALQAPNTPTVVATNPTVTAVPSLPVVVNNPPNIPQPPAQQPGPVVVQAVPQVPVTSGPQNNPGALQAPNTPTVVATNPTVMAVPSVPVVVNNPPNIPQPPAQRPGPVVAQAVPQVPVNSGPQNNAGALQAPNTPTVVATNPTVVAVPSVPVVVNNPPNVPQPPAQPTKPVVLTPVPQVPVTSGPQNNPGALQAPDAPTVVASNPTVVAVPSLPVAVNNPPTIPQPPAQQPGPVVVQAVPQLPVNSGPQNNPGALLAPNAPTVVATQPNVVAVPSLPVVVNNPPNIPQPPAQQAGPVVAQSLPQPAFTSGPQNNPAAVQAPNPYTVVAVQGPAGNGPAVNPQNPPTNTSGGPGGTTPGTTTPPANTGGGLPTDPNIPPQTTTVANIDTPTGQKPGDPTDGLTRPPGEVVPAVATHTTNPDTNVLAAWRAPLPASHRESELVGLNYSVIYRNYEAQSLVNDIGRPLYALTSGYELFLYLEGRQAWAPAAKKPATKRSGQ